MTENCPSTCTLPLLWNLLIRVCESYGLASLYMAKWANGKIEGGKSWRLLFENRDNLGGQVMRDKFHCAMRTIEPPPPPFNDRRKSAAIRLCQFFTFKTTMNLFNETSSKQVTVQRVLIWTTHEARLYLLHLKPSYSGVVKNRGSPTVIVPISAPMVKHCEYRLSPGALFLPLTTVNFRHSGIF
jgi:hypothetical protein